MTAGALGGLLPGIEAVVCALVISALCTAYWHERRQRHRLARSAAALADSERYNRALFELAPIGLVLCEMSGRILDCNPAYAELVGRSPAEARRLSVWDITPDEYLEAGYRNVHAVATEGRCGPFEKVYLRPDGATVQVRVSGRAIEREGARCILVTVEDIGPCKAARAALEALVAERTITVHRQAAIIEQLRDAVLTIDRDGRITSWNGGATAMFGWREQDIVGRPVTLLYADDAPERGDELLPALHPAGHRTVEVTLRRKSGEAFPGLVSLSLVRDAAGLPQSVIAYAVDLTAQRAADAALRASEAWLSAVIEHSPVGIFFSDPAGRLTYVNRSVLDTLPPGAVEDLDGTLRGVVHPEDRPWVEAAWRDYVEGRRASFDCECRCVVAARAPLLVHVRAAPITVGGTLLGFVGIFENIAERRRLELQLQQAQKMEAIGQLTGGIAHDFNNALCSILGFASLALARHVPPGDAKLGEYLGAVIAAGERARDLVQKLLAFSRATPCPALRPSAPAAVAREAASMLASAIPAGVGLEVDLEPDLDDVPVDETELHQVIVNLLLNARDAVGDHGRIGLAVRVARVADAACTACHAKLTGRYVEIAVSDDGSGIAPEVLQRIFDPFFTTKPVGKGTGMGLSVSHGILHRAGGHVLVERRAAAGTVMRVLLPPAGRAVRRPPAALAWRRAS